ncbi:MAG: arylsulfatase [Paenibacillus sp.]|jgi:arylsulfatase A-like enzyme|nr:arylsulfatase [Paenibacillus sp.]
MRQRQQKPNVIVFFTDQQRWDTMSVYGNPLNLTPNLDRTAASGTHAYNAFTCQPVCGPARSCLQTGLYATASGCFRNGIPLPENSKTMAHYFKEHGYQTGYIGKWHLGHHEPYVPEEKRGGYDYWLASELLEFTSDAYDTVLYDNNNEAVKLPGYRVDALTDAAIRYVDSKQKDPFFLFISYLEPHHQNHTDDYPAPTGYREQYTGKWMPPDLVGMGGSAAQHLGGYFGMVKRLDEAYGRLLDTLRSLNLLEDTVVLFTSDHGNHFKTRNGEYKRSGHDSSIRVPTVFTGPGFEGGGQLKEVVSLIDLPPTLLDAAGIPKPEQMQGRSILPLVNRGNTDWPQEVFVQISESQVGRAVRTRRWKYGVVAPGLSGSEVPGADSYTEDYMYDLDADPYELTNLIGLESHRKVADVMKERLIRRMVEAGETAPAIVNAKPVRSGQRRVSEAEAYL